MRKIPRSAFAHVIEALLTTESRSAVKYLADDLVVRATRTCYRANKQRPYKNQRSETLAVTFGKPNYRERKFLRTCRKAGEPVPVRKVQLTPYKRPSK